MKKVETVKTVKTLSRPIILTCILWLSADGYRNSGICITQASMIEYLIL
jgi:hypothetical protein